MELFDTIEMMSNTNYKERFKAEYYQTKIRLEKLEEMIQKYKNNELDFEPNTPLYLLQKQSMIMSDYLDVLDKRAEIEEIALNERLN